MAQDPLGRTDYLRKQLVSPGLVDLHGDALTPDMVDAEWWLGLPMRQGMQELGIDERAYRRIYREVQDAVYTRDNRASQGGVRVPIIIKRWRANQHIINIKPIPDNPGLR